MFFFFAFLDDIEEELAPLIEAQEVKITESYEDQVSKVKAAAKNLSWIHILSMYDFSF